MDWRALAGRPPLDEFAAMKSGRARLLVRRGFEPAVPLLEEPEPDGLRLIAGGRSMHPVVTLPDGREAVVRRYRRGGLVRHLVQDRYFGGHRAFAEVAATERARRAGVRVPTVLLAREDPAATVGYRACLATVLVPGARESAAWLAEAPEEARRAMLAEAGRQVGRMHAAGVAHPDLNLRNLLVVGEDGREVWLIDFDRAQEFPGAVPPARRARDLRRLARSARKLRAPVDAQGWKALREGYGAEWPESHLAGL